SGGCERRARSSLLRRAFRHASSVVAALAALAPRLVRLAHHYYSDRLLARRRSPTGRRDDTALTPPPPAITSRETRCAPPHPPQVSHAARRHGVSRHPVRHRRLAAPAARAARGGRDRVAGGAPRGGRSGAPPRPLPHAARLFHQAVHVRRPRAPGALLERRAAEQHAHRAGRP